MISKIPGSFHLVVLPSLDISLSHVSERHTWMPGKKREEQDTALLHSCPFRLQSWPYTHHFFSHPIGQNLLMCPFFAAGEAGNMIFILSNLAKNSISIEEGVNNIHIFKVFDINYFIDLQKDCSYLYFPLLCQHRTIQISCQINNSRKWSSCYFILHFPNFWWYL